MSLRPLRIPSSRCDPWVLGDSDVQGRGQILPCPRPISRPTGIRRQAMFRSQRLLMSFRARRFYESNPGTDGHQSCRERADTGLERAQFGNFVQIRDIVMKSSKPYGPARNPRRTRWTSCRPWQRASSKVRKGQPLTYIAVACRRRLASSERCDPQTSFYEPVVALHAACACF